MQRTGILFIVFLIAGMLVIPPVSFSASDTLPNGKDTPAFPRGSTKPDSLPPGKDMPKTLPPGRDMPVALPPGKDMPRETKNPYATAEITIKIIPSPNNTYGYDILIHGRPLVHQPNIPGLPGNEGFTTQKRAQTVAEFVVRKIRNNEMPPTVTLEDLNRMGVVK